MTSLVKGDVAFPLSNHAWMNVRSYEWWSPATTGSSILSWDIGHSMNLGQSGKSGVVIFRNEKSFLQKCLQKDTAPVLTISFIKKLQLHVQRVWLPKSKVFTTYTTSIFNTFTDISGIKHMYSQSHYFFQLLEALNESSFVCASASPCAAAFVYHSRAWFTSLVTPPFPCS
jgi:hypothetical protein